MDMKTVLITGANSGIGLATVSLLAQKGYHIIGTHRKTSKTKKLNEIIANANGKIETKIVDVCDETSIENAINAIIETYGRIDILINNAGYGLVGPLEMVTIAEAQKQFDVNFFGIMRMIQAVAPHMRQTGAGTIINISSLASICPSPGLPVYSASKAAVESLSETLAMLFAHWNIQVKLVEPGPINTPFPQKMFMGSRLPPENNPYNDYIQWFTQNVTNLLAEGQLPEEVAQTILEAIESKEQRFRYPTNDHVREMIEKRLPDPDGFVYQMMERMEEVFSSLKE